MAIEWVDPDVLGDNPYQHLTSYFPDRVKHFAELFQADCKAGLSWPPPGHPHPVATRRAGKLIVADGHHRRDAFRLLKAAGHQWALEMPVEVPSDDMSDGELLACVLETAINRKVIKPLDQARGFKALADQGWTQQKIAARFGVSQPNVSKSLAVLSLPDDILKLLADSDSEFTLSHAYELLPMMMLPKTLSKMAKLGGKGLWINEYQHNRVMTRNEVAQAVARELNRTSVDLLDKETPFPPDWNPGKTDAIHGACDGCPYLTRKANAARCFDRPCHREKVKAWIAAEISRQKEIVIAWAEAHGLAADRVIEINALPPGAQGKYDRIHADKLAPCSAECACLRLTDRPAWDKGVLGPCAEAPDFVYTCLERHNRTLKQNPNMVLSSGNFPVVLSPEAAAKAARDDRRIAGMKLVTGSVLTRLVVPRDVLSIARLMALGLGLEAKPDEYPETLYRRVIGRAVEVAAKSWSEWSIGGMNPHKLLEALKLIARPEHVAVVDKKIWIALTPNTDAVCQVCQNADSTIFCTIDGEDAHYVCDEHLMALAGAAIAEAAVIA